MEKIRDILHETFIPSSRNDHRPHAFRHFMLSIYSLALLASQFSFGMIQFSPVAANPTQMQKQIYTEINSQRHLNGEENLKENILLDNAAKAKLKDMFSKNYWDHTSPSGEKAWDFINQTGYSYKAAGENLAKGFFTTDPMIKAWMASPSHKKNILDQEFTETGIAVGNGSINGRETTIAVQLFGAPAPVMARNQALVAGEKSDSLNFGLSNPAAPGRIPFFTLYLIIFTLIIFDGIMIRINKSQKNKKHMLAFRTSLGINVLVLAVLCLNITQIW